VTPTPSSTALHDLFPRAAAAPSRAVVEALVHFADPDRSASRGALTEPSFARSPGNLPLRRSPLAQEIFGPIADDRCACGRVEGAARRGEVCERCGVGCLPRSARAERWGHVEVPWGFVHPALAPVIGEVLGCTADDVLSVARYEAWLADGAVHRPPGAKYQSGSDRGAFWDVEPEHASALDPAERQLLEVNTALRRLGSLPAWAEARYGDEEPWFTHALAGSGPEAIQGALASLEPSVGDRFAATYGVRPSTLILARFPVPPPDLRPLEPRAGGIDQPGPDNLALGTLIAKAKLAREQPGAERSIISLTLRRDVQRAAERAARSFGGDPAAAEPRRVAESVPALHGVPPTDPGYLIPRRRSLLGMVTGLAFVDDETLLLGLPYATFWIEITSGRICAVWRSTRMRLLGAANKRYAFYSCLDADHVHFAAFDLETMQWSTEAPSDLLAVPALADDRSAIVLVGTADRRMVDVGWSPGIVLSSCGQYAWNTNVHRLSGELELEPWWDGYSFDVPLVLRNDGTFSSDGEESDDDHSHEARALALSKGGWWLVDQGLVFRGLDPVLRLELPSRAAAFDGSGRLAIATDQWLALVDVEARRVVTRWSLRRLRRELAQPRREVDVSVVALHAALCAHGTLPEVAAVDPRALARLDVAGPCNDTKPMGKKRGERVSAVARAASIPHRLQRPRG
jgi:hypothetical protein